jgi:hypothetical protein
MLYFKRGEIAIFDNTQLPHGAFNGLVEILQDAETSGNPKSLNDPLVSVQILNATDEHGYVISVGGRRLKKLK